MKKAIWNGQVIAESDETIIVEGNDYFPPASIKREFFKESDTTSTCPWKGFANYYDIEVEGSVNKGSAWYYKAPSEKAKNIKDYVAFWKGVEIK